MVKHNYLSHTTCIQYLPQLKYPFRPDLSLQKVQKDDSARWKRNEQPRLESWSFSKTKRERQRNGHIGQKLSQKRVHCACAWRQTFNAKPMPLYSTLRKINCCQTKEFQTGFICESSQLQFQLDKSIVIVSILCQNVPFQITSLAVD